MYDIVLHNIHTNELTMRLFPTGIAEGEAFCNRVEERELLKQNIQDINHTVLVAPRRYGKSSLVNKVVKDSNSFYAWTDFLTVSSQATVEQKIAHAVAQLIYQLAPDLKKLQMNFQKFFKSLNPDLVIQTLGTSLSIHPNFEKMIEIDQALLGLDAYAQEIGKTAVIIFDEFQQISLLKDNKVIEALIRHAVERSKNITYVFLGSNRHLLAAMFSGSDRPLYRLCETMVIERISEADYYSFLNKAALDKWQHELTDEVFKKIMLFTERHPYYVNGMCNKLWKQKELPVLEDVDKGWNFYVKANKGSIIAEVIDLSINQKRIIQTLAIKPTQEILSKGFSRQADLSSSSIQQAIGVLIAKDIILQDEKGLYKLLDPGIRHYLLT